MGKGELVALLKLSCWCLVMVGRLFLAVPQGCLQFVIVVFPDYTHFLELIVAVLTINFLEMIFAITLYVICVAWQRMQPSTSFTA